MRIPVVTALAVAACGGGAREAAPAGPAATTKAGAPCRPERDVLVATEVFKELEALIPIPGEERSGVRGTFGTCTVVDGDIRTADGVLVGELGCGLRILVPGIRDDLGLELGATGRDVLAKKPKPVPPLRCLPNGPRQARCMFDRAEGEELDATAYVVAGVPGEAGLAGEAAVTFFAARAVVEIDVSVYCH